MFRVEFVFRYNPAAQVSKGAEKSVHTLMSESANRVSRRFLAIVLGAIAVTSVVASFLLLVPSNALALSAGSQISPARLLAATPPIAGLVASLVALSWIALRPQSARAISQYFGEHRGRARLLQPLAALTLGGSIFAICTPSYLLGQAAGYIEELRPLLAWAGSLGLISILATQYRQRQRLQDRIHKAVSTNVALLRSAAAVLALFMVTWGVIAVTRVGIAGREDYWYEAGVPILPLQALIAVVIAVGFKKAEARFLAKGRRLPDAILFLGIWLITAVFWAAQPPPSTYFNTAPRPPTHESFPFSDAAGYDLRAQFALIGQGLSNGRTDDNPLYPAFLVLAHGIGGQSYATVMAIQAAVLAVLPAIIYLFARQLGGRATAMGAAALAAFRGGSAIAAASFINLASPKQMLTDFPTAVAVGLILLVVVRWVRGKGDQRALALWVGGTIALGFLLRQTIVILFGLVPVAVWGIKTAGRQRLYLAALASAAFVLALTPWGIRNATRGRNPVSVYLAKFRFVSETRQQLPTPTPSSASAIPTAAALAPPLSAGEKPPRESPGALGERVLYFAPIMASHFAHGLITSALILPTSPVLNDLRHTLRAPDTYWIPYWTGELSWWRSAFLFIGLAVVALGMASAWTRHGVTGVLPFMAFLAYQLANALARTSGGRYIVPVDWILGFYLIIGLSEVYRLATLDPSAAEAARGSTSWAPWPTVLLPTLVLIIALGSLPLAIEWPFPRRYAEEGHPSAVSLDQTFTESLAQRGYTSASISDFLSKDGATQLEGRLLYPRYFSLAAATHGAEDSLVVADFPHLEFSLIGPAGARIVVLPSDTVPRVENASDVVVLGCDQDRILQAAIVFATGDGTVYVRHPASALNCPFSAPVCDESGTCR